jgi:hypothetical protein
MKYAGRLLKVHEIKEGSTITVENGGVNTQINGFGEVFSEIVSWSSDLVLYLHNDFLEFIDYDGYRISAASIRTIVGQYNGVKITEEEEKIFAEIQDAIKNDDGETIYQYKYKYFIAH